MAKLPEITRRRSVMPLRAADSSKGHTQNLQAISKVLGTAVDTVDKVFESEAKLSATRRLNEAKRQYMEESARITQSYHNDRDMDAEQYRASLGEAQSKIFGVARSNASGRVSKYLEPGLDSYRTEIEAAEIKANMELIQSRAIMDVQDIANFELEALQLDPSMYDMAVSQVQQALDDSMLDETTKRTVLTDFSAQAMTEAITTNLNRGGTGITDAVNMADTDAYRRLPPDVRAALDVDITNAVVADLERFNNDISNQLLRGALDDVEQAFGLIDYHASALTNKQGQARDDFVRDAQSDFAYRYLQGLNMRGEFTKTEAELASGKFDQYLDPDDTTQLMNQIAAGANTKDIYVNMRREPYKRVVDTFYADADADPTVLNPHRLNEALESYHWLIRSYEEANQTIPPELASMYGDIYQKYDDAQTVVRYMYAPQETADQIRQKRYFDMNEPGAARERELALKALDKRNEAIRTDAAQHYINGNGVLKDLPPVDDPGFADAIAERMQYMSVFDSLYGADHSGVLREDEAIRFYDELQKLQGTDRFMPLLAEMHGKMSAGDVWRFWDQMIPDTEGTTSLPMAGRLVFQGKTDIAQEVLKGEALLNDGTVSLADRDRVDSELAELLGSAFGEGEAVGGEFYREANIRAIKSLYAARLYKPENRGEGFAYDSKILQSAVDDVTGGIIHSGGRDYAAPTPTTTETQFKQWKQALGHAELPPMFDGAGKQIPQEHLNDGFREMFERFELVETGKPGSYYVMDMRSISMRGDAAAGALLTDAAGKEAVIHYDPSIISSLPVFHSPRRGPNRKRGAAAR